MGKGTDIEWADHTFNVAWGCEKVSPGCKHCYADAFDHRLGGDHWGRDENGNQKPLKLNSEAYWRQPLAWNASAMKRGVIESVFCSSMTDVMYDHPEMPPLRERLWDLIKVTPYLRWLLLTKRPENFGWFLPNEWYIAPPPNVWLGVTVENADYLGRVEVLRRTPAAAKFISYEPALGPVDFTPHLTRSRFTRAVDWIIAGAESGPGAREAQMDWYRAVRDQIALTGSHTKFFLKQHVVLHGKQQKKFSLPLLDGRQHTDIPR